jgi:hypothetical protein
MIQSNMILTFLVSAAEAAAETMMKMSDDKNSPTEPPLLIPFQGLQQERRRIMRTSIWSNIVELLQMPQRMPAWQNGSTVASIPDAVANCYPAIPTDRAFIRNLRLNHDGGPTIDAQTGPGTTEQGDE